jgi:hypothetical protein
MSTDHEIAAQCANGISTAATHTKAKNALMRRIQRMVQP